MPAEGPSPQRHRERMRRRKAAVDARIAAASADRDVRAAQAAWAVAAALLRDEAVALVVLDELNIALRYRYLGVGDVAGALRKRPTHQHVVITGRGAPPELLEIADTVTDMRPLKHAFDAGVRAQLGIEL